MDRDWARLGQLLKAGRERSGLEQQQIAHSIGVGRGAIRNIEKGDIKKASTTVRSYARLVGWTDDAVDTVLDGGDPTYKSEVPTADSTGPAPAPATSPHVEDLSLAVQAALRNGPLLDSKVLRVRTPAGDITATIVARGDSSMTPEELHEALRAWQAHGPTLVDDDTSDPPSTGSD